jgi:hypothetical protein
MLPGSHFLTTESRSSAILLVAVAAAKLIAEGVF